MKQMHYWIPGGFLRIRRQLAAMLNAVKAAANALGNPDFTEEQVRSAAQALQAEVEKAPADPAAINLMMGAAAETQVECHPGFGPENARR